MLLTPQKVSITDLKAFVVATIQTSPFSRDQWHTHTYAQEETLCGPKLSCKDQLFVAKRHIFAWWAMRQLFTDCNVILWSLHEKNIHALDTFTKSLVSVSSYISFTHTRMHACTHALSWCTEWLCGNQIPMTLKRSPASLRARLASAARIRRQRPWSDCHFSSDTALLLLSLYMCVFIVCVCMCEEKLEREREDECVYCKTVWHHICAVFVTVRKEW